MEIVIAATILITALALGAQAYRHAVDRMEQMTAHTLAGMVLPEIRERVRTALFEGQVEGEAAYDAHLRYTWQAAIQAFGRTLMGPYDEEIGDLQYGVHEVQLYQVSLTVVHSHHGITRHFEYEYSELTWQHSMEALIW